MMSEATWDDVVSAEQAYHEDHKAWTEAGIRMRDSFQIYMAIKDQWEAQDA